MNIKKILLLGAATILMSIKMTSQCQTTATANYSTLNTCLGSNITLSGTATLKKMDDEGQYVACGGSVSVQLQKLISAVWTNTGTAVSTTGLYNITIPSSYGSGTYRVLITNPASSCACSSTSSYSTPGKILTFNPNSHNNSFSLNGTPTFNSPVIPICGNTQINLTSVIMTNQSSVASVNKWRIGTAHNSYNFVGPTWETSWHVGPPPSTINILTQLGTWGAPIEGLYSVWLQTYNGCSYTTNVIDFNVYPAPTIVVGQKYDAINSNIIPANKTCSSPFTNICPSATAPYSYILTAQNTSISPAQISAGQWSCTLEEVNTNSCSATPTTVFVKPYTTIGSISNLSNIDLNAYAVAYGNKPANYVQNNSRKWKFTLNIKYSCNTVYSYTTWLAYNNTGCRIINSNITEESTETLSDNALVLFPNPTNSNVEIKTDEAITSITVYDINGKESKIESINNKIDLSNFKSGIYTLKIYTENGISTKKVMKQD